MWKRILTKKKDKPIKLEYYISKINNKYKINNKKYYLKEFLSEEDEYYASDTDEYYSDDSNYLWVFISLKF